MLFFVAGFSDEGEDGDIDCYGQATSMDMGSRVCQGSYRDFGLRVSPRKLDCCQNPTNSFPNLIANGYI